LPTPIQIQAIPPVINGKDLLGIAQTGTGKTAAFALPILNRLANDKKKPLPRTTRALVLTPTRELAIQVCESFETYGAYLNLASTCIYGGVSDRPQKLAMTTGVDILVATPGRLLDLIHQGALSLKHLGIFVLDEADQMLDMGFIHPIRKIVALLPPVRQNLFFSATMPDSIASLASKILRNPVRVEVTPSATPIETIDQIVYPVEKGQKQQALTILLKKKSITRALVFTRTKRGANQVCENLQKRGINAAAIHGNKSQNRRQESLAGFQSGKIRVLVATDIAARGIDVEKVSHVFNFDLPEVPETYVHRIGRTARAGESGTAISFCSMEERGYLAAIDRLIGNKVPRGEAGAFLKSDPVRPDSIDSSTGRYDKDLGVYLPGTDELQILKIKKSHPKNNRSGSSSLKGKPGSRHTERK
jgi:ATP-dependent RNA helicase RhlE